MGGASHSLSPVSHSVSVKVRLVAPFTQPVQIGNVALFVFSASFFLGKRSESGMVHHGGTGQ